jgi:hypothetical protein
MGKYPGIVLNKFNLHLLSTRLTAITNWIVGNNGLELAVAGLERLYIAYTFKKLIFTTHHIEVDPMEKLIAYI